MRRFYFSEKALTNKNEKDNDANSASQSERYTIFHALFEAMKDKDKKRKRK